MSNRWMAVALGAAALALPATALAEGGPGKGHEKAKQEWSERKAHKHGKHDKAFRKARKPRNFVFRGVYEGDGVVKVVSGNGRVRRGGFVGQNVTFDLSHAKLLVADTDGVPGITAADVKAGDVVLVMARLPRGTKAPEATEPAAGASVEDAPAEEAPAAFKARKLIDLTNPPGLDEEEPAEAPAT